MQHTVYLDDYDASPSKITLGTAGSYGYETIQLVINKPWEGLELRAHFDRSDKKLIVVPVDMETLSFDVPEEITELPGSNGFLTFDGIGERKRIISTSVAYFVTKHGRERDDHTE